MAAEGAPETFIVFGQNAGGEGGEEGKDPTSSETPSEPEGAQASAPDGEDDSDQKAGGEGIDLFADSPDEGTNDSDEDHVDTRDDGTQWIPRSRFEVKNGMIQDLRQDVQGLNREVLELQAEATDAPDPGGGDLLAEIFPGATPEKAWQAVHQDKVLLDRVLEFQDQPQFAALFDRLQEPIEEGTFEMPNDENPRSQTSQAPAEADPGVVGMLTTNVVDMLASSGVVPQLHSLIAEPVVAILTEDGGKDFSPDAIGKAVRAVIQEQDWSKEFVTGKKERATPPRKGGVSQRAELRGNSPEASTAKEKEGPQTPSEAVEARRAKTREILARSQNQGGSLPMR